MSHRRDASADRVDRRGFMLGATSALGAASLAASLSPPDRAEGAPAGTPKRKKPKTEKFTIHQDVPVIIPLDAGASGPTAGDSFYFHAALRSAPAHDVIGEVFGTKIVVETGTAQNPAVEQRITHLVFTFNDREDQIVVAGVADYPAAGAEFDPDRPVVRAIIGGTGEFIGALGELTSTRHPDGGYTQVFALLK